MLQCLVRVAVLGKALSSGKSCGAAPYGAVHGKSLPAVEPVREVGVGKQVGDFNTRLHASLNGTLEHFLHCLCLCFYLLHIEQPCFHNVESASVGIGFTWSFVALQVILEQFACCTIKVGILVQISLCAVHLIAVSLVGYHTGVQ